MRSLGLTFDVVASDIDETLAPGVSMDAAVVGLAAEKARSVAAGRPGALVIAADTLVELDGSIYSKPESPEDAVRMLGELRGRTHRVATGLVLLHSADVASRLVETMVTFRNMSNAEIEAYVSTGEPLDKAGAYGIQGLGAAFVQRIEGDYYNVAGLPVAALNELLREAGLCVICYNLRRD